MATLLAQRLRWLWIVAAAFLLNVPWLWLLLHTPPGHTYTGLTVATESEDYFTYLLKIRLGQEGIWGYVDRYTAEPMHPAPLYLFYAAFGQAGRLIHLDPVALYVIARVLSFLFYGWALWALLQAQFGAHGRWRWLAVLGIAGPSAWIVPAVSVFDLFPEGSGWGVALGPPHFAFELGLLCLCYLGYWRRRWRPAGWLAAFLIPWIHPFMLAPALGVPGLHWLLARRGGWGALRYGVGLLASAMPGLLLMQWAINQQPVLRAWAFGTITASPPLGYFFIFSGVLGLLAIPGILWWARPRAHMRGLRRYLGGTTGRLRGVLGFWAVALLFHAVALELPLTFNRRFWLGLALPLGVLGGQVLLWLMRRTRLLGWLAASLAAANFLLVPVVGIDVKEGLFYVPTDVMQGLAWLDQHTPPDTLILANPQLGLLIPAYTHDRTYLGHWAETLNIGGKLQETSALTHGLVSPEQGRAQLAALGVDYVAQSLWQGPQPASLPPLFVWPRDAFAYLPQIYESADLVIYRAR